MVHGVIPALLTPFTEGGAQVDVHGLKRLCEFLVSAKVDGIFVTGTTGEFVSLSPDERRLVIREAVRYVHGKMVVIVHVTSYHTAESVALARFARTHGADAIGAMPPYFYPMDDEAQYVYFSRICEAADGLPVFLYNIPSHARNEVPLSLVRRLKETFPHLRGIKDSSGDMARLQTTVEMNLPEFDVICGADEKTLAALQLVVLDSVTSTGNAFPEAFQAIYRAFAQGDSGRAEKAQERLNMLIDTLGARRHIAACKEALRMRGIDVGTVRPPQCELTEEERTALRQGLAELGVVT